MNQLPIEIPLDYDAKRTRNRLAQRRRREKQRLENAAEKEPTSSPPPPPQPPQPESDEMGLGQRAETEMTAWEQSRYIAKTAARQKTREGARGGQQGESNTDVDNRNNVQFTPSASLDSSWCPANASAVMSPWLGSDSPAPPAATSPARGRDQQDPDAFFLNPDIMFQPLMDPLLRPVTTHPVVPSPRRYSHPGRAAMAGVSSSPRAAAQDQVVLSRPAQHQGGAARKRHSIAIASASPVSSSSSAGSTGPPPPPPPPPPSSASTVAAAVSGLPDAAAERRVAKMLIMAEEMGFESFDDLAATYYTARFPEGSLPRYAQSASRSRRLGGLLTDLHASARGWAGREARGYHDGQMRLLETLCADELAGLCARADDDAARTQPPAPVHRTRAFVTNMIRQLFTEDGAARLLHGDTQLLREQMPSLWSLLSQVAQQTGSTAEDASLAICVFVNLLRVPL
ncbi:hypothetical protein E4U53_000892 [Claviceps sorghi]|nr:hypothetical protein E4U53_000892 [Claviceps sorghi]